MSTPERTLLSLIGIYLVTLSVVGLFLTGCFLKREPEGPKFQVGDCVEYKNQTTERWEKDIKYPVKILEIGKEKYLYAFVASDGETIMTNDWSILLVDSYRVKVPCPKIFNGVGGQYEE